MLARRSTTTTVWSVTATLLFCASVDSRSKWSLNRSLISVWLICRVLYRELVIYTQNKDASIFYEDDSSARGPHSQHLKLRPSVTFHFYMNYVPKVEDHGKQLLSTKETQGMQKFNKKARVYLSMSTVDKILKVCEDWCSSFLYKQEKTLIIY